MQLNSGLITLWKSMRPCAYSFIAWVYIQWVNASEQFCRGWKHRFSCLCNMPMRTNTHWHSWATMMHFSLTSVLSSAFIAQKATKGTFCMSRQCCNNSQLANKHFQYRSKWVYHFPYPCRLAWWFNALPAFFFIDLEYFLWLRRYHSRLVKI